MARRLLAVAMMLGIWAAMVASVFAGTGRLRVDAFRRALLGRVGKVMDVAGPAAYARACNRLAGVEVVPRAFLTDGDAVARATMLRDLDEAYFRMVKGLELERPGGAAAAAVAGAALASGGAGGSSPGRNVGRLVRRSELLAALGLVVGSGILDSAAGGDGTAVADVMARRLLPRVMGRDLPRGAPAVHLAVAVYVLATPSAARALREVLSPSRSEELDGGQAASGVAVEDRVGGHGEVAQEAPQLGAAECRGSSPGHAPLGLGEPADEL